jgi:hypothetical protein
VVNSDCPVINNVCVSDDASANPIGTCQYYFDCSTESCAPGFVCDSFLTNKCTAPLQNEPECNPPDGRLANLVVCATVPSLPRVIGLSGVAAPDSPGMVQCETSASTSPINSNDALECIAEIEAALNSVCQ